jgi:hypothetical protein
VSHELRLADAGLALDDDRLPAPREHAPVLRAQQRQLLLASDQQVVVRPRLRARLRTRAPRPVRPAARRLTRARRLRRDAFSGGVGLALADGDGGDELVAARVEGAYVARRVGRVAERATNLRDRLLEHRVGREDVRPDLVEQFFFGHHATARAYEIGEDFDGARLKRHGRAVAVEQADRRVQAIRLEVERLVGHHRTATRGGLTDDSKPPPSL